MSTLKISDCNKQQWQQQTALRTRAGKYCTPNVVLCSVLARPGFIPTAFCLMHSMERNEKTREQDNWALSLATSSPSPTAHRCHHYHKDANLCSGPWYKYHSVESLHCYAEATCGASLYFCHHEDHTWFIKDDRRRLQHHNQYFLWHFFEFLTLFLRFSNWYSFD